MKKSNLDKFYTKPEVAEQCLHFLYKYLYKNNLGLDYHTIIEPSAGNGSFYNLLKIVYEDTIGIDIEPECDCIKADFLKTYVITGRGPYAVIGNPPFSLALKFIEHSTIFADIIAFILPNSFKKDSLYNKINPYFYYEDILELPKNSFLLNGKDYDVPCSFFIIMKNDKPREIKQYKECEYFSFVKKEEADCEIYRVGGNTAKCAKEIIGKKYNYFIKVNTDLISVDDFVNKINSIKFKSKDFVAGPRSISKQELIKGWYDNYK